MKTAILDLTGCKGWDDLHERIQKALGFPDYYGHNWSAFWDCMKYDCEVDKLIIIGEKQMPKGYDEQFEIMHRLLDDTSEFRRKYNFNDFTYENVD